jgi:cytochrome c biogenesis protein ResB
VGPPVAGFASQSASARRPQRNQASQPLWNAATASGQSTGKAVTRNFPQARGRETQCRDKQARKQMLRAVQGAFYKLGPLFTHVIKKEVIGAAIWIGGLVVV